MGDSVPPDSGWRLISGEPAEIPPARPLNRRPANEQTLGFLLREAIKLARGHKDPTLMWLLHKCVERMKGAGEDFTPPR
jgi:hypothetical protein